TGGIVLCGGLSSRMGRSKAWLQVAGEPMLARMVRVVGEVAPRIVVAAADGQELPDLPASVRIVRDAEPRLGPLAGFAAALTETAAEIAFVAACDMPNLDADSIRAV